jgi:hypothetical protein
MLLTVDQSGVDQRFKLSFVVSFHDHQLPNFQGRTLWTSRVLDCACCRICTSDDINHLARRLPKETASTHLEGSPLGLPFLF